MRSSLAGRLRSELDARAAASRLRGLRTPEGIDCSSNDYLGLSVHPGVLAALAGAAARGVPAGSAGSRLLSGNHPEHLEAESAFARFIGRPRALLFGSGFAANLALLSAVPSRRDLILLDASSHASLKEGARASLAARRTFRHNDIPDLRRALHDRAAFADVFIVAEGIYSMDGDHAPLREMAAVAGEHEAHLIVDEAHATGLYGRGLRGTHELCGVVPFATVHPCGKALGSSGAFIAGDDILIDYLVNCARPFLFSTAPPPVQAAGLAAALRLLPSMEDEVKTLFDRAGELRARLAGLRRWRVIPSDSPIVPVLVGSDADAVRAAALAAGRGFDLRPIRPPTVPAGTSRLRVSVTVMMTPGVIAALADAILHAEETICGGSHA